MSQVPGINAKHAIITPTCRHTKTNAGAFEEAVERLRVEYHACLAARGEDGVLYHLVLAVERADSQKRDDLPELRRLLEENNERLVALVKAKLDTPD